MSSSVCHAYAQTGDCRYSSACKFAHVDLLVDSNRSTKRSKTYTQTPLDEFFARYPGFEYNSSASASLEFYRLCNKFNWDKEDEARQCAHNNFKNALVQQFNHIYGTNQDDLTSWRTLCQIVQISPIPDALQSCREAVKNTHVNIVDLLDTKTTEKPVKIFVSEMELSEYTKRMGKFFPRDNAYAGGLLKYLLRHIINPRPEVVSSRRIQKKRTEAMSGRETQKKRTKARSGQEIQKKRTEAASGQKRQKKRTKATSGRKTQKKRTKATS
ncbi:hypothetical protein M405DRAFT_929464 [Rhizopogon salebrosus TDB-379]|nr:hypothetical protein M405DRAFT_929464 [Rhizopogon salebrosus TDB-379]